MVVGGTVMSCARELLALLLRWTNNLVTKLKPVVSTGRMKTFDITPRDADGRPGKTGKIILPGELEVIFEAAGAVCNSVTKTLVAASEIRTLYFFLARLYITASTHGTLSRVCQNI